MVHSTLRVHRLWVRILHGVYVYVNIYIYIYTHTCEYTGVYVYVNIYICIYIHVNKVMVHRTLRVCGLWVRILHGA